MVTNARTTHAAHHEPVGCATLRLERNLFLDWWLWLLAGLLLTAIELFTPGGFFLLFFGIGALGVGGLASAGLAGDLVTQVLLFLGFSVAGTLLFRRALVNRFGQLRRGGPEVDAFVGTVAEALQDLAPGALGKVALRGSTWSARNTGSVPLRRGQHCTVERVDGLTLWVRIAGDEFLATSSASSEPVIPVAPKASPVVSAVDGSLDADSPADTPGERTL